MGYRASTSKILVSEDKKLLNGPMVAVSVDFGQWVRIK